MKAPRASLIPALVAALAAAAWAGDGATAFDLNEKGLRLAKEGRLEDALKALEAAHAAAPDDDVIRTNLARCGAKLGVELLKKGDLLEAELVTRKARDFLPNDAYVRLNLADVLDVRGYPARAALEIKKALELGPELAPVHEHMGTMLYREGRIEDAAAEWEKAAKLAPNDAELAKRLADAKAEIAAEAPLSRRTSSHFEIRFDMEKHAVLASKVLAALEETRGVVGAELQRFGQDGLVVVLLPADSFATLTGSHGWVAGVYDGRIRLPVKDADQREAEILARARHEYMHSVLAPLGRRAPSWLNEGLAQAAEKRSAAQATRRVASAAALPFESLEKSFAGTKSAEAAGRQYDTSLAFVEWLRAGARASSFRLTMTSLFDDQGLDEAFKTGYESSLPELYAAFQKSVPR